jgi:hypothetical protein
MMKKVLALMLVLGMTSVVNAGIIDVVVVGEGSLGHAGTSEDPLVPSETIEIAIILTHNPYPGYSSYDGYVIDTMDLDLHVSGPATLSTPAIKNKAGEIIGDDLQHHADWDVWSQSGNNDGTAAGYEPVIVGNSIAQMLGGSFGYILGSQPPTGDGPAVPPTQLVWNLFLHCDGYGPVTLDLTLNGSTHYWEYSNPSGGPYGGDGLATEGDLGDLVIHQIPEPMTIALLGLGGLFLRRRR